jgi:hypothetical protein
MKSLLQILMLKSIHRTVRIKTNSNFTKTKSETDKLEFLTTNPIVSPRLKSWIFNYTYTPKLEIRINEWFYAPESEYHSY